MANLLNFRGSATKYWTPGNQAKSINRSFDFVLFTILNARLVNKIEFDAVAARGIIDSYALTIVSDRSM